MRRSEIIEGVRQVVDAINESNILSAFKHILTNQKNTDKNAQFLAALRKYAIAAHNFNYAARRVVTIFNLDILEDPTFWAAATDTTARISSRVWERVDFAHKYAPQIIELLNREYSNSAQNNAEPIISNGKEMKLLSVTIFENDKRLSSPQRLINVLESVNTFYTVCAYIHEESPDTLSVVACDSGSDKSFDFLGVAKLIECVTQLIENMWDRVVFFREKQLEVRMDLINKSLPIYEKLDELEKGKKMAPELAEKLRRNISSGVNKFIESGASIPEVDARSTYNSRSLLSPVQKLLVSAPEEMEETSQQNIETQPTDFEVTTSKDFELSNLSSNEQQQLNELLNKLKGNSVTETGDTEDFRDSDENTEVIV
jgi:hypothetical protein